MDAETFWSRVNKSGPTMRAELGPCWMWRGKPNSAKGYGRVRLGDRRVLAHRAAWELERGAIPDGLDVLHRCDNTMCVNPSHLLLGTHSDNMVDMHAKGRATFNVGAFSKVHRERYPHGEQVQGAKLTADAVRAMRAEYAAGATTVALGHRYGISQASAHRIVKRQAWKHVA